MSTRRQRGVKRSGRVPPTVVNQVKRELARNLERKFTHITYDSDAPDVNGTVTPLSTVAQGTTKSTRIGDVIHAKSLSFRAFISVNQSSYPEQMARFMLIKWYPNSTPSVANIIESPNAGNFTVLSHLNNDYKNSFEVLFDSGPLLLSRSDSGSGIYVPYALGAYSSGLEVIKLNNTMRYTTASSTDCDNRLYLVCVTASATQRVAFQLDFRFSYTDA